MTLYEQLLNTKYYQDLLNNFSDDEKKALMQSLKEFMDTFETKIIKPLENYKKE